jgi:hypothetical protein
MTTKALLAMSEKATPVPWEVPPAYDACNGQRVTGGVFNTDDGVPDILIGEFHFRDDAQYAVAACNAAPDLCRRVDAAEANVERLRDGLGLLLGLCDHGDFSNGVTDPTGSIDEGCVRAGEVFDEVRKLLSPKGL